jgi:predicted HicB family RNase H-like nuclease
MLSRKKLRPLRLRYPESLGERLSQAAAQNETSLNAFIIETLNERLKRR